MALNLNHSEKFSQRHNSNSVNQSQMQMMLEAIGVKSLDELIDKTVPESIRLPKRLNLPSAQSETEFLADFKKLASKNKVFKSFIGTGYYDTFTPNVILRNILENPAWYTAYTPYQAEIAQGRMEALINFQTLVMDLTDEGTAAAEAMTMLHSQRKSNKKNAETFFVSELCHPQTIDILLTRANPLGIKLLIGNHETLDLTQEDIFGLFLQYPATNGEVYDYTDLIASAKELNIFTAVATDLLALTILTPPGEMGADVVVGSAQRMGVPMGYGGPHAAFFATKDEFKRYIPGRIIGVSIDSEGNKAYRMALQTREQHIRREKATSNICTAQVLLSVMASMYAVYHGPQGLKTIAERVYGLSELLKLGLEKLGYQVINKYHFDTITLKVKSAEVRNNLRKAAEKAQMNFRYLGTNVISIALDETKTLADVKEIFKIFQGITEGLDAKKKTAFTTAVKSWEKNLELRLADNLTRKSEYLTHPVFNTHHTEHSMLRYMKSLENKDLSMVHSMIPLGSCTMKLNATAEMIPVTWAEIGGIHPFAPREQAEGYTELFKNLEAWLCEITGFAAVSLQPNSGAQGEYAGLMTIRNYLIAKGEGHRNIALIPASAHGTNPASAVMAGMQVVVTKTDERGNIDVADLKAQAEKYAANLACLMVTYPSTHGVFEETIQEICEIIHQNGGQVYMDGANMNAQVGLTSPAMIGADVCHLYSARRWWSGNGSDRSSRTFSSSFA